MTPKQRAHWAKLTRRGQIAMIRSILRANPNSQRTVYSGPFKKVDYYDVLTWLTELQITTETK